MKAKLLEADSFDKMIAETFTFNKQRTYTIESEKPAITRFIEEYVASHEGLQNVIDEVNVFAQ